ncbi:MAG: shikimate kinase [Thermotogae bacterium]|nr:MAG: shikimate kinase [Thermotogota bacterium]
MVRVKRSYYLVGLPGSGKSSILKILSDDFGYPTVDIDELFGMEFHSSYYEILRNNGPQMVQKYEKMILKRLLRIEGYIIATMGFVASKELFNGTVIYIKVPRSRCTVITQKVQGSKRKQLLDLFVQLHDNFSENSHFVISVENKNRFEIANIIDSFVRHSERENA